MAKKNKTYRDFNFEVDGKKFKKLRTALGIKQIEVARMSGLNQPFLSKFENKNSLSCYKSYIKLLRTIGIDVLFQPSNSMLELLEQMEVSGKKWKL